MFIFFGHSHGMTYSRDTTALSELTGLPFNTWTEQWEHECEARGVLKLSKEERDVFLSRVKGLRGEKAVEGLQTLMEQIESARVAKP